MSGPFVAPEQAGTQEVVARRGLLDSRLRGNDGVLAEQLSVHVGGAA